MAYLIDDTTDKVTTAVGQGILFITFLINMWVQDRREKRNRQWQLEDAERLAKKTEDTATLLKTTTESKAVEVKEATQKAINEQTEVVTQKVAEVTQAQTEEIAQRMRTRVSDLGKNFDKVLNEERQRRRSDD